MSRTRTLLPLAFCFAALLAAPLRAADTAPEPHAAAILEQLLGLKSAIAESGVAENTRYVTVWDFDGTILEWIAKQSLPAGRAVAVMINGGTAPDRYKALFHEVEQRALAAPN